MSARLTPTAIAQREIDRLERRELALMTEYQAVKTQRAQWLAVLRAANGEQPTVPQPDDAVEAE